AKFSDVNKDTVMGAYIGAATAAGIVNGVSATSFKPNDVITRQDMATMMMRAAKVAEVDLKLPNSADSYLQNFTDRGKVSAYAKTSVAQAIYLGIINGKSPTRISPTTNATRAEGAVMIQRLLVKADFLTT
ncbi:S-layer homology domain-containing protein, partial [Mycobacterium tuberculosis]